MNATSCSNTHVLGIGLPACDLATNLDRFKYLISGTLPYRRQLYSSTLGTLPYLFPRLARHTASHLQGTKLCHKLSMARGIPTPNLLPTVPGQSPSYPITKCSSTHLNDALLALLGLLALVASVSHRSFHLHYNVPYQCVTLGTVVYTQ